MNSGKSRLRALLLAALAAGGLLGGFFGGLLAAPAPALAQFTWFMSEEQEARVGKEQHEKVIQEFGGAYNDPNLARYVESVGRLLVATTEKANQPFTFTILDSPIVNAFALPGGYVYVTRGLLALAGNEAELAGVLAHEIGHVTARHAAQRYSQGVVAGLGLGLLNVLTGSQLAGQIGGLTAELVLKGYSREQESEADGLGVRSMSRAGFDPHAMATFLTRLQANDQLQAQISGQPGAADQFSLLQTHPRTADRVEATIREASGIAVRDPIVAQDIYLGKIDGLMYGDNPDQGVIRGRRFLHPKLGFGFEVPEGFRLINSENAVLALGPDSSHIEFTGAERPQGARMTTYLTSVWAKDVRLNDVEPLTVNGMEAATGQARLKTQEGAMDVRLVAIAYDAQSVYRFLFATQPAATNRLAEGLRKTTYSFRPLTRADVRTVQPLRVRVVTAGPGDTVESLARRQPFESFSAERVRVLNGLAPGAQPSPGQKLKLISGQS
ncbi:MAG: M48 family metalloprotease [Alphaproteobacteria bacterium]